MWNMSWDRYIYVIPEVSCGKFGFCQRKRCLSHHLSHLSLRLGEKGTNIWDCWMTTFTVWYNRNITRKMIERTSIILRSIWRKRMERASDFFLSRLRPVWAPFRRAFMMVWALQAIKSTWVELHYMLVMTVPPNKEPMEKAFLLWQRK